ERFLHNPNIDIIGEVKDNAEAGLITHGKLQALRQLLGQSLQTIRFAELGGLHRRSLRPGECRARTLSHHRDDSLPVVKEMPAHSLVQRSAKGVPGKYSPQTRLPARRTMRCSKIGEVYGHLINPKLFIDLSALRALTGTEFRETDFKGWE